MVNTFISDFGRFAPTYCSALRKLFFFNEDCGRASRLLEAMATLIDRKDDHYKHASIAPYYWIEPTSLIGPHFLNSVAEQEGFASYAPANIATNIGCWERAEDTGDMTFVTSTIPRKRVSLAW